MGTIASQEEEGGSGFDINRRVCGRRSNCRRVIGVAKLAPFIHSYFLMSIMSVATRVLFLTCLLLPTAGHRSSYIEDDCDDMWTRMVLGKESDVGTSEGH